LPSLQILENLYRQKPFRILLVSVREQRSEVALLFEKVGVDLQVVLDREGTVSRDYHVFSHPIKFLIDRQGDLMAIGYGYRDWESEEIARMVNMLIRESVEPPRT